MVKRTRIESGLKADDFAILITILFASLTQCRIDYRRQYGTKLLHDPKIFLQKEGVSQILLLSLPCHIRVLLV